MNWIVSKLLFQKLGGTDDQVMQRADNKFVLNGHKTCYSLFTLPTRTRQSSGLVRVGGVNTNADKTRQFLSCLDPVSMSFVSSRPSLPISEFSVILNIFETEQLQIGNWIETRQNSSRLGQDKTLFVLSPIVFTPWTQTRQDKFCLVRVGGVNKLLQTLKSTRFITMSLR